MRTKLFSPARLRSDEVVLILGCVKRVWGLKTNGALCKLMGLDNIYISKISNAFQGKQNVPAEAIQIICKKLDTIYDEKLIISIKAEDAGLYKYITRTHLPIENAISKWAGIQETQEKFNELRTGRNGSYYILRLLSENHLICSWIHILPSTVTHPVPRFLTYRSPSNGRERFVRGVMFQSGGLIYTFGKTKFGSGFRTTLLSPNNRPSGRNDMIGARLGVQENPDKPYGYPIYLYQLKNYRPRSLIKSTVGIHEIEEFRDRNEVKSLDYIINILRTAASNRFGVSIHDAFPDTQSEPTG